MSAQRKAEAISVWLYSDGPTVRVRRQGDEDSKRYKKVSESSQLRLDDLLSELTDDFATTIGVFIPHVLVHLTMPLVK